jgi:hypothetical protein
MLLITLPTCLSMPQSMPYRSRLTQELHVSGTDHKVLKKCCVLLVVSLTDKYDAGSSFWASCVVSNYVTHWYNYTIGDVRAFQQASEDALVDQMRWTESLAMGQYHRRSENDDASVLASKNSTSSNMDNVLSLLKEFQDRVAGESLDNWHAFFFEMASNYRDFHRMVNIHDGDFRTATVFMGYPR